MTDISWYGYESWGKMSPGHDPLLQSLLPTTLAGAYRNPWGTRSSIPHPAQASCSSAITMLDVCRARSATPASPCPTAQWYQRWRLCPGAGVGSICTACSQGRTSPSSRAGRGWRDEGGGLCHRLSDTKRGCFCKSPGKRVPVPARVCAGVWEKVFNQERQGREGGKDGGRKLHLDSDE